ncbi:MAG TPA: acyl-CoA dehydrogenase family protein [Ruminiclostridium sp.]|nr:acyl-CoA dehydrogenase family protein [Ruminiclostridium sp.]
MDFNLSKEQIEICKSIEEFSRKKLNENVFTNDDEGLFSCEKWKACGYMGIHGLPVPEEYGGSGQDMLTTALAIKSLAHGCKDEGLVFSICAQMLTCTVPILIFGNEAQKAAYLNKLSSGELIGGNGITEPDAGSDAPSINTTVLKTDDAYIINGTKIFVTNGPIADLLIIYAKHPNGMSMANISAFIIEKGDNGFKAGQEFKKMGLRTSPTGEIILDNCKLSHESLLGREKLGMLVFNKSMLWERIIMGAYHVGAMEQQYRTALEYAGLRKQFGQQIIKFSSISDKLVEMKMRIETSKLMLYKACWDYDNGNATLPQASMVKLLTSESKVKNSLDAAQIFGAYGYMKEYDVEKQLRDSIAARIYSGTSEIQRKIISESLEVML